ncbi:hypothetical protein [Haladaptatus cibarius]|uniref:hypothetical protein n=1 Tax=Haladaptatus cibarius TaxID=453847 RepID=UPI0006793DB5|nr:hypothetical protein [Haladaptatus cibarius]
MITLIVTLLLSVVGIAGAGVAYWYYEEHRAEREAEFDELAEEFEEGEPIDFSPPDVSTSPLDYLRVARHLQRGSRLAKKGYVKWYRLDSTLTSPQWVKPEQDGSGLPKVTVDGQPYYFPRKAMVADGDTGAWVALHREGEADPINLRDPAYPGIEVDLVERTINLEAEDKPPGFFDNLFGGMSQTALMYGLLAVTFVIYAGYRFTAGGM